MKAVTLALVTVASAASPALAQAPMFKTEYPLYKGAFKPLNRNQLEELTSYPASIVTPLPDQPDATKPDLLKQLPLGQFPTVKLHYEPGGSVPAHYHRFKLMAESNSKVEILDDCASACTIIVTQIAKQNLCFGPHATLKFHQARYADGDPATAVTENLYNNYPPEIRRWIDERGGLKAIPYSGWMYLNAPELWKMGYRRCSPG